MSGFIKAIGGFAESSSQREAGQIAAIAERQRAAAQAKSDLFNAKTFERNAALSIEQANIDARRARRSGALFLGKQQVAIAKSGFTTEGFGDQIEDAEREVDLDELLIRQSGMLRAEDFFNRAALARAGARDATSAGEIAASAAIFTGETRARGARLQGTVGALEGIEQAARAASLA